MGHLRGRLIAVVNQSVVQVFNAITSYKHIYGPSTNLSTITLNTIQYNKSIVLSWSKSDHQSVTCKTLTKLPYFVAKTEQKEQSITYCLSWCLLTRRSSAKRSFRRCINGFRSLPQSNAEIRERNTHNYQCDRSFREAPISIQKIKSQDEGKQSEVN